MREKIMVPSDILGHRLFSPEVKIQKISARSLSRFEAWLWLMSADFVDVREPDDVPVRLDIDGRRGVSVDMSQICGWKPKDTKQWLTDLRDSDLVSQELHAAMIGSIRSDGRERTKIQADLRQAVWDKTNGSCVYCGDHLTMQAGAPNSFQVDHVLPVKLGGSDDPANLVPACANCNGRKHARTALRFMG